MTREQSPHPGKRIRDARVLKVQTVHGDTSTTRQKADASTEPCKQVYCALFKIKEKLNKIKEAGGTGVEQQMGASAGGLCSCMDERGENEQFVLRSSPLENRSLEDGCLAASGGCVNAWQC